MDHTPSVAVVILSWNGSKFLYQFIPDLLQTTYSNVTFYVADNASTDDSCLLIEKKFPQVQLIKILNNEGFAKGYNIALSKIKADIYVLLNQDVSVTPQWIEPVVAQFNSNKNIAIIQPKILSYHQPEYFEYAGAAGGYLDNWAYPFCRGRIFDYLEKDSAQYADTDDLHWASGACMFIRAEIFHFLEGFDSDFFAHMEEIDLCWRIKNAGYKIAYASQSSVYHVGGGSLPYGSPKKTMLNYRNNLFMILKNYSEGNLLLMIFIRLLLDGMSGLQLLMKGKFNSLLAVIEAHFLFYKNFIYFLKKRKHFQNLYQNHGITPTKNFLWKGSIIWNYFILKRRKFTNLNVRF